MWRCLAWNDAYTADEQKHACPMRRSSCQNAHGTLAFHHLSVKVGVTAAVLQRDSANIAGIGEGMDDEDVLAALASRAGAAGGTGGGLQIRPKLPPKRNKADDGDDDIVEDLVFSDDEEDEKPKKKKKKRL